VAGIAAETTRWIPSLSLIDAAPSIGGMKIACFGGAHLDTKVHLIDGPRLGSSNPATTTQSPGGVACNIARDIARMGAQVTLCSLVGDDMAAAALRSTLTAEGVDDSGLVIHPQRPTAGYTAVLDPDGGLYIAIADMEIYDAIGSAWVEKAARQASGADLWVVDANLPTRALEMLAERAPVPVLADTVSASKAIRLRPILDRLTGVFPDRAEAAVLANGYPFDHEANAEAIAQMGTATVVVSLGPDGAHLRTGGMVETRPAAISDQVVDVTGAGDALLAGYAFALAAGGADPLAWGLAAASLAVETDESVPGHLTVEAIEARLG